MSLSFQMKCSCLLFLKVFERRSSIDHLGNEREKVERGGPFLAFLEWGWKYTDALNLGEQQEFSSLVAFCHLHSIQCLTFQVRWQLYIYDCNLRRMRMWEEINYE